MPTILIQTGHVAPREPGFETGTGAAGEQEAVKAISAQLEAVLKTDNRFQYRVIPGKIPGDIKSGAFKVDAFVSLHCDGSTDKTRRGWGVGYPAGAVNRSLATGIAAELVKIHPSKRLPDNYTTNMSGYYGWSRVPTPGPEVLVEHGFVSNPAERQWIHDEADKIARCYYAAFLKAFGMPVKPPKPAGSWVTPEEAVAYWDASKPVWEMLPGPRPKPAWVWQMENELARRRAALAAAEDV